MLAKARRKGREVTNSCLSAVFRKIATCSQTLHWFCKTHLFVWNGFVFGYLTHWKYAVRVCVFACIVWQVLPYAGRSCSILTTIFKGRNLTHTLLAGQRWSPGGQGGHMTSSQHDDIATAVTHHFPLVLCHPFTYLFFNPLLCFQTLIWVLKNTLVTSSLVFWNASLCLQCFSVFCNIFLCLTSWIINLKSSKHLITWKKRPRRWESCVSPRWRKWSRGLLFQNPQNICHNFLTTGVKSKTCPT